MQARAVLTGEALTDVVHYMRGDECDTTIKVKDKRPLQFHPRGVGLGNARVRQNSRFTQSLKQNWGHAPAFLTASEHGKKLQMDYSRGEKKKKKNLHVFRASCVSHAVHGVDQKATR